MLFDIANVSNLPQELKDAPRWICWRAVPREDGRVDKVPVNPHRPAYNASTTDSTTWGTFSEALGTSVAKQGLLGIGFVFSDEDAIFGIDVDHCVTPDGVTESAQEILRNFRHTYTEMSTSGTGYHIYGYGDVAKGVKRKLGEIYAEKRFFTVTGSPIADSPCVLAECPPALIEWYTGHITQDSTPVAYSKATGSHQDILLDEEDTAPVSMTAFHVLCDRYAPFYRIWLRTGRKYPSPSEEAMAIGRYAILAGWCDQEVYRIMRQWYETYGLGDKNLNAHKLTIYNLRNSDNSSPGEDSSCVMG